MYLCTLKYNHDLSIILLASIVINWKEDGTLEEKQSKEDGYAIPYRSYLKKKYRVLRLIFVIGFMVVDGALTVKNVKGIF